MSGVHYSLYDGVRRQYTMLRLAKVVAVFGVASLLLGSGFGVLQGRSLTTVAKAAPKVTPVASSRPVQELAQLPAIATPVRQTVDTGEQATLAVQAALADNPAQAWSVAVYDITNQKWLVRLDDDRQMESASLYKLYVAYALAQKIPFGEWDSRPVAGHTVRSCVDLMLRVSDNNCGEALASLVGYAAVDKAIHSYGFTDTTLDRPAGPLTTASDTTRFMNDLYRGQLLDPATSNFILNSLARQKYRSAIPAGCPGCTVYNKTGLLSSVAHDTAIVKSSAGTYAVTIMSTGGSYYKIAHVEQALQNALVQAAAVQ